MSTTSTNKVVIACWPGSSVKRHAVLELVRTAAIFLGPHHAAGSFLPRKEYVRAQKPEMIGEDPQQWGCPKAK